MVEEKSDVKRGKKEKRTGERARKKEKGRAHRSEQSRGRQMRVDTVLIQRKVSMDERILSQKGQGGRKRRGKKKKKGEGLRS